MKTFGKSLVVKKAYQRGEYTEGGMNGQLFWVVWVRVKVLRCYRQSCSDGTSCQS